MNAMPFNHPQIAPAQAHLSYAAFVVLALAAGLGLFALVLLATVVRRSQRAHSFVRSVKSVIGTLLWVAPAVALIAFIGTKSRPTFAPAPLPATASSAAQPPDSRFAQWPRENGPNANLPVPDSLESSPAIAPAGIPEPGIPVQPAAPLKPDAPVVAESLVAVPDAARPAEDVREEAKAAPFDSASSVTNLNEVLGYSIPQTAPRLKVRSETTSTPAWSGAERGLSEDANHPVFRSGRYITPEEATAEVTTRAIQYLERKFQTELNAPVHVDVESIDRLGVDELVLEKFQKSVGLTDGRTVETSMYIAHLKLAVSEGLRNAVYADYRQQLVNQRLKLLLGGLALITLLLGTVATYFRLDEATDGRYRTRLKVAAAAVLAAVGMAATVVA